jgi:hypothetical protein
MSWTDRLSTSSRILEQTQGRNSRRNENSLLVQFLGVFVFTTPMPYKRSGSTKQVKLGLCLHEYFFVSGDRLSGEGDKRKLLEDE